jgi:hypothetical protein
MSLRLDLTENPFLTRATKILIQQAKVIYSSLYNWLPFTNCLYICNLILYKSTLI